MNQAHALEGIILAAFAFEENTHILSILSKEHGKVKCVAKSYKKNQARAFSALLGVEIVVIPSEKELWKCREVQVVTSYPNLRKRLDTLNIAAEITDLLSRVLPLHLAVPEIFQQYCDFLHHLPHFQYPQSAALLFLAKFCAIEGILPSKSAGIEQRAFDELYTSEADHGHYRELLHRVKT